MMGKSVTRYQSAWTSAAKLAFVVAWPMMLGQIAIAQQTEIAASAPGVDVEENDEGFLFTEQGRPILFYQRSTKSKEGKFARGNYVHPLYDLHGNVITEDFPDDHLHQRGVFWAWHQVLVGDKPAGDSWLTTDFAWHVVKAKSDTTKERSAILSSEVEWLSPDITDTTGKKIPFVSEHVTIEAHAQANDARTIDFEIKLLALQDSVSIGGSEDDKGYGGFSCRFVLPSDVRFHAESGVVNPVRQAIEAGPWVNVSGTFGKEKKAYSGIVIMTHPTTDGFPQPWILRERDSMQNPVFPGRRPVPVSKDVPIVLRYRLVIHSGQPGRDKIQTWYDEYSRLDFGKAD